MFSNLKFTILSVFIVLFVGLFNPIFGEIVGAQNSSSVYGYAWSDNIGWVSFDSGEAEIVYGVSVNMNNGNFSGYAWSDNIGWIDFNPISGYPFSPNHGVRLESDNSVTGWARALSYGDGWDGWINMGGTNYEVSFDETTKNFSGYAWGSDVVGWLSFGGDGGGTVSLNPPFSVSLNAEPSSVISGNESTLTWSSSSVDSCTANWTEETLASYGSDVVYPEETTEYIITCTGGEGVTNDTATIEVFESFTANNDTAVVNEGSFVNINVLNNDAGVGLEVVDISNPGKGSVINNTTSIRYINDNYGSGSDSFIYTVKDDSGEEDTATVYITIYKCGDSIIQLGEECDEGGDNGECPALCSESCFVNNCSVCGNGTCETGEDFVSCPEDCGAVFEEF